MLSDLLAKYGKTHTSAADEIGVSRSAMSMWARGDQAPMLTNAMKVAQLFSIEDGTALLYEWGFESAATGLAELRMTYDPDRANGWRLQAILGELRQLNTTLARIDGLLRHEFTKENTNDV